MSWDKSVFLVSPASLKYVFSATVYQLVIYCFPFPSLPDLEYLSSGTVVNSLHSLLCYLFDTVTCNLVLKMLGTGT